VSDAILLDAHIALWLDSGSERLGTSTRTLIDACWRDRGTILISAVTGWEIAQLVHTGRIVLDRPVEAWLDRFTDRPGVTAVPLTARAAAQTCRLHRLEDRDPADRLLIATAIEQGCPLVTYDSRIARFAESDCSHYGFSTRAYYLLPLHRGLTG
jgi:PIN domain nuclease of toxin-antitoxin system